MVHDVAVLVGSLRKESHSSRLAEALIKLAPAAIAPKIVPIGDLPLYNQDLETDQAPAAWTAFRDALRPAKAVLFVTPEYNRSIPAALKNAIDVASRPYGQSVLSGKPAAVASQSPGGMGGFGANHALRQSLVFLDMPTLQQPELYLAHSDQSLGAGGEILEDRTRELLQKFIDTFARWVARLAQAD